MASVCYDQRVRIWLVTLDLEGRAQQQECLLELNILDPAEAAKTAGGLYDHDNLDDEALQMIVKPNSNASSFDFVHPNCMVFTSHGRLFVGDSRGQIAVWDVALR